MKAKHSFCILHSAFCIALAAASAFAQGSADNPELIDDGVWRTTPWLDRFVPDDFIYVKPHAALVGTDRLEIVWLTKEPGSGWVDWSQDGWATTNRAWSSRHGVRDFNERIHKVPVEGFDPSKPVAWRAVSMKVVQLATGHTRYEGEPNFPWYQRAQWNALAARRVNYASGAVVHFEDGVTGPLASKDGKTAMVAFNDVHHALSTYERLVPFAGTNVALAVFNGDITDHSRSEDDIVRYIDAPQSFVGKSLGCATRYVRGNHEVSHGACAHLADYMGLQNGRLYGAVDLGGARIVFLDTALGLSPGDTEGHGPGHDKDMGRYLREEAAWLEREVQSEEWRRAAHRIVVAHIPPVFGKDNVRIEKHVLWLYQILNGKGVSLMVGAHEHAAHVVGPNAFVDFPVVIGGGPHMPGICVIRCEWDASSISAKAIGPDGKTRFEWSGASR